jgi:hypothetical protein
MDAEIEKLVARVDALYTLMNTLIENIEKEFQKQREELRQNSEKIQEVKSFAEAEGRAVYNLMENLDNRGLL